MLKFGRGFYHWPWCEAASFQLRPEKTSRMFMHHSVLKSIAEFIPLSTGFERSQVVQAYFHWQQALILNLLCIFWAGLHVHTWRQVYLKYSYGYHHPHLKVWLGQGPLFWDTNIPSKWFWTKQYVGSIVKYWVWLQPKFDPNIQQTHNFPGCFWWHVQYTFCSKEEVQHRFLLNHLRVKWAVPIQSPVEQYCKAAFLLHNPCRLSRWSLYISAISEDRILTKHDQMPFWPCGYSKKLLVNRRSL